MTTSFGVYHVDPDRTTLRKLRQMIETRKDNGMVRRTLLFSEVLQTLSQSMNWHNYPRDIALFAYQFGTIVYKNGVNENIPRVIRIEDEEMSIGKLIPKGDPTRLPVVVVFPSPRYARFAGNVLTIFTVKSHLKTITKRKIRTN